MPMQYRRLGSSGLKVSELSLGSWVTYHNQVDARGAANEMLAAAMDAGVNFFDNAEVYARGQSEVVMGEAFKALKWPRLNYIVSTKFFWGLEREGNTANRKDTLNRKYLMQAIDGSLKRMGLDFIDLVYCHRPDPHTPIEETVWAMSDMITRGKALYWGTSEWTRRRHPRRLGHRRQAPPAQAGDGAAAVPPVPSQARRAGIRAPLRRHRPRPHDLEPARQRPADRQVQEGHSRRAAAARWRACRGSPRA